MVTRDDGFSWLPPRCTPARFAELLAGSPVLDEAPASEYWERILAHHVDPLMMLGQFQIESGMGRNGMAPHTHSWGNLRNPPDDNLAFKTEAGFRWYLSWRDGCQGTAAHWDSDLYRGMTIGDAIYKWAPPSDGNDTEAYISALVDYVNVHGDNLGGSPSLPGDGPIPHAGPPPTSGGGMRGLDIEGNYSYPVRMDLANNAHSFPDRPTNPDGRILAIVKHVTAGEDLGGALSWNRNPSVQAAAHFYIDKDGTVVQDVSLANGAWANGVLDRDTLPAQFDEVKRNRWNPNDFTISIEHVGQPGDADFPTDAQLWADARITADLCDAFQIPVDQDHIIGHYRFDAVNRPNCPGSHWDFGADVQRVATLLNGPQGGQDGATAASGTVGSNVPGTGTGTDPASVQPTPGNPGEQPGAGAGGTVQGGAGAVAPGAATGAQPGGSGARPVPPGGTDSRFFPLTGHSISGPFLQFYNDNGFGAGDDAGNVSLRFGYPRTEPFVESSGNTRGPVTVQYFDKCRMELRNGRVVLGNTGLESLAGIAAIGMAPPDATL